MRLLPLVAACVTVPVAAGAAPTADVVVVWAPGAKVAPIEDVARAHGAAAIDRSPAPPPAAETGKLLARAMDAFDKARLDEARAVLDQTRDLADRTGAAGLSTAQLSDLFLYRGLVRATNGDDTGAWDELVASVVIDPSRDLDPARFPPKIVELFRRAHDGVLHDHPAADLQLDAPAGCTAFVDGAASSGKAHLLAGPHWIRVACPDRLPWGQRVDLTSLGMHLAPDPSPYAPPSDAELLVQARVVGARAMIVAEVHGPVASARLVGLDGRERDRRSVAITGDLAPLAAAVADLLVPKTVETHWYRSRWAWAAGAAVFAAAVLVPLTAAIASESPATTWTVKLKGLPPL